MTGADMAISPKLQMRQVQALAMTPQLLQSIRLLQLGQQELAEFLAREAEKNPLLIVETPQLGQTGDSPAPFQQAGAAEPSASPQPQSSGLPPARTGNSERAAGSSGNRGDGDRRGGGCRRLRLRQRVLPHGGGGRGDDALDGRRHEGVPTLRLAGVRPLGSVRGAAPHRRARAGAWATSA